MVSHLTFAAKGNSPQVSISPYPIQCYLTSETETMNFKLSVFPGAKSADVFTLANVDVQFGTMGSPSFPYGFDFDSSNMNRAWLTEKQIPLVCGADVCETKISGMFLSTKTNEQHPVITKKPLTLGLAIPKNQFHSGEIDLGSKVLSDALTNYEATLTEDFITFKKGQKLTCWHSEPDAYWFKSGIVRSTSRPQNTQVGKMLVALGNKDGLGSFSFKVPKTLDTTQDELQIGFSQSVVEVKGYGAVSQSYSSFRLPYIAGAAQIWKLTPKQSELLYLSLNRMNPPGNSPITSLSFQNWSVKCDIVADSVCRIYYEDKFF